MLGFLMATVSSTQFDFVPDHDQSLEILNPYNYRKLLKNHDNLSLSLFFI